MSIIWQAPGAEAISEFARQTGSGAYLTGTCVETSALMCRIAQAPWTRPADGAIGDTLQQMVNDWRAGDVHVVRV